ETGLRPHELGQRGEEGDDVVLHLALDLVDALDVEGATLPHRLGGLLRDDAQFGQRVAGVGFNLELDAEPGFGFPQRRHGGTRIAWDHGNSHQQWRKNTGAAYQSVGRWASGGERRRAAEKNARDVKFP